MAVNAQMPASTNAQTIVRPDSMKEAAAPVAIRHKGAERKLRPRFRRQGQIPWRRKPRSKVGARVVRAPEPRLARDRPHRLGTPRRYFTPADERLSR